MVKLVQPGFLLAGLLTHAGASLQRHAELGTAARRRVGTATRRRRSRWRRGDCAKRASPPTLQLHCRGLSCRTGGPRECGWRERLRQRCARRSETCGRRCATGAARRSTGSFRGSREGGELDQCWGAQAPALSGPSYGEPRAFLCGRLIQRFINCCRLFSDSSTRTTVLASATAWATHREMPRSAAQPPYTHTHRQRRNTRQDRIPDRARVAAGGR